MNMKKTKTDKIKISNIYLIIVFVFFVVVAGRMIYLCLVDFKVGEGTIGDLIASRNIVEEVIEPTRGSIRDKNGNVLAQTVASYKLIAYLDESRSDGSEELRHVADKELTATKLAEKINLTKEEILAILSPSEYRYQVEFGTAGNNLSQIEMESIASLNLPGIDFIKSTKRYYPNGDFASYTLGYTVTKENENNNLIMIGELGIEEYYNDILTGKQGYITYEQDRNGYKIANSREYIENAEDGDDVYLTIDNNIQLFIENAVKKASSDSEAEWVLMVVADAKTGAILGYSSTPSFDPNLRNMTSYIDPLTGYAYEPGSTMKIFSYMCAIESGNYDGEATYESGSKTYESEMTGEKVTISDWNKTGWGTITYNKGFALSSNIAVANLVETVINKNTLRMCYEDYGFGETTGFTMEREASGDIDFTYQIEAATAGYGQGIMVTPVQQIQALTAIANDGVMLKPYIVSKIVDGTTGENNYVGSREEVRKIVSESTIEEIKELMRSVINPDSTVATGSAYYMEGYDLIGKTGTAQIYDYQIGSYLQGESDYIYSFSGLYPGEEPEIIVYMALKQPKDTTNYIAPAVKDVIVNVSNYLNIVEDTTKDTTYEIGDYTNKNTVDINAILSDNSIKVITLGTGDKIINQYPNSGTILTENDIVVLLTNNYDKTMVDLNGLSYKDAINTLKLMEVVYEIDGKGYVYEQSIPAGTIVEDNVMVSLKLKEKYTESS